MKTDHELRGPREANGVVKNPPERGAREGAQSEARSPQAGNEPVGGNVVSEPSDVECVPVEPREARHQLRSHAQPVDDEGSDADGQGHAEGQERGGADQDEGARDDQRPGRANRLGRHPAVAESAPDRGRQGVQYPVQDEHEPQLHRGQVERAEVRFEGRLDEPDAEGGSEDGDCAEQDGRDADEVEEALGRVQWTGVVILGGQEEQDEGGGAQEETPDGAEGQHKTPHFVQGAPNRGAQDESKPEEGFDESERGAHVVRELLGEDAEGGRAEGRSSGRLHHSDGEGQRDKRGGVVDLVEEPEKDARDGHRENAGVVDQLEAKLVQKLPIHWTHNEDDQFVNAEHEAVLRRLRAFVFSLLRIKRGLDRDAQGIAELGDAENNERYRLSLSVIAHLLRVPKSSHLLRKNPKSVYEKG